MRPTSPCSDLTISVVGQANLSSDLVALTTIRSTMDPHVLPFVIPLARTELIDDSTLRNHILNSLRHLPPEQFLLLHMLTLEAWWNKPTHRLLAKFTEQLSSALAVTELILRSLVWPEPAGLVALCQGFPKLRRIHLVGVRWGKPWKPYRPSAIHGVPNLPSHVTELHMLGGLHTLESQTSSVLLLHSLSYTLTKLVLDVPTVSDITSGFEGESIRAKFSRPWY
ncbi:hypothetical protein BD310DRAFT_70069 [Dichomitus squalens]|uniref:Uncharacterized protein n=1 Tax=Dichomitus squalens TaxID=114155 RepID=A0A4Q9PKB3_9APHY|nr:hypothetical protein BD310DRAFT_70069 [Dichomitus squalens]